MRGSLLRVSTQNSTIKPHRSYLSAKSSEFKTPSTCLYHTAPRVPSTYSTNPSIPPTARPMSTLTLSDLRYVTREDLASQISSSPSGTLPAHIAVIDVRDSDHIGGHIRGSTWIPSHELDYKTPELVRTLKGKKTVVFHCALSQLRGPSAALRYLREKNRLDPEGKVESEGAVEDGEGKKEWGGEQKEESKGERQQVVVLQGGFTKWQEKYGEDRNLTEGYRKDIWEFGY